MEMALPTMWIRKNMLQSPTSDHHERQMSESEMRVLRSIQKLSIPEWYLNSSSRPPKILSNDTPIDRRPSSWKNLPVDKPAAPRVAIVQPKISTVCHNGVLETDIEVPNGNQRFATYKINRASPKKDAPPKVPIMDSITATSRAPIINQTFPRVSPSRKIQNINIVFPQQPEPSKHLQITDLDESDECVPDMTSDSLEVTSSPGTNDQPRDDARTLHEISTNERINQAPNVEDTSAKVNYEETKVGSSARGRSPVVESSKINAALTPRQGWASVTSAVDSTAAKERPVPISPPRNHPSRDPEEFQGRSRASLPVRRSPPDRKSADRPRPSTPSLPLCDTVLKKPPQKEAKRLPVISPLTIIHFERSSTTKKKQSPPVSPRTKIPSVPPNGKTCEACKGVSATARLSSRAHSGFRPKSVLPSIPEKSCVPPVRPPVATKPNLPENPLLNSTKKSLEVELIVKNNQPPGKSLVTEIIKELNQRCQVSSQPTYVTPASKNFVKKLVAALENGVVPASLDEDEKDCESSPICRDDYNDREDEYSDDDVFVDSENGSEDDVKSVAVSTSISYKGTDSSSDTDLGSPTMRYHYHPYDWDADARKRNEQHPTTNNNDREEKNKNYRDTSDRERIAEKEDDDWLYWNKRSEWNLPRTSSLLSIVSKASSESAEPASPCISPIDQSNERAKFFSSSQSNRSSTWSTIYRTKKSSSNKTLRLNETTVLDSGYSDRSSFRSSVSSYVDDKFPGLEYTETTQTASEGGMSCFETTRNSVSSQPGRNNRIHGSIAV